MAQQLTTLTDKLPGLLPDQHSAQVVKEVVLFWPDDGSPPKLHRELQTSERIALERRLSHLSVALRPISMSIADREASGRALALMFAGFPSLRNADAQGMVSAYVSFFDSLPLFAVLKTCEDVIKGKLGIDLDWPPTSPAMYAAAEAHCASLAKERFNIDRTLKAIADEPEMSDEQRQRIKDKFKKLVTKLQPLPDPDLIEKEERMRRLSKEASDRMILRQYAAAGIEPQYAGGELVSLELVKLLRGNTRACQG